MSTLLQDIQNEIAFSGGSDSLAEMIILENPKYFSFTKRKLATDSLRRKGWRKVREAGWIRLIDYNLTSQRTLWTKHEEEILSGMYKTHSIKEIAIKLNRSFDAVYRRANKIGLHKYQVAA